MFKIFFVSIPSYSVIYLFRSHYMPIFHMEQKLWHDIGRLMAAEMRFLISTEGRTKREKMRKDKLMNIFIIHTLT
jgi:hypothetical protein